MKAKHKFHARPCVDDGIRFDSKKERDYYRTLKMLVLSGDVLFFLRQVPIDLPGCVKYRVDFVEFHSDGSVHFVDVKGYRTETYKLKKKQIEALYPITIEEV